MRTLLLTGLALAFSSLASGQERIAVSSGHGGLRVTNGIQTQPSRLSAIVYQDGCSGTFVSPTTIITAAHCANNGFTYQGVRTRSHQSMGDFYGIPWDFNNDVRVLIFPQPVAPAWIPVVNEPVFQGLHVVMAGYGTHDLMNGSYDARFRYGTNVVGDFHADGRIINVYGTKFETIDQAEGTGSSVGPGDSGGALLWNGRLAGVTSAISSTGDTTIRSLFVNVTHPAIRGFLNAQIASQGADIRFSEEGSIPYQECYQLDQSQRTFTFLFDVPHSNIRVPGGAHFRVFRKYNADRQDTWHYEDNPMGSEFYTFAAPSFGAHLLVQDGHPTPSSICFI